MYMISVKITLKEKGEIHQPCIYQESLHGEIQTYNGHKDNLVGLTIQDCGKSFNLGMKLSLSTVCSVDGDKNSLI